MRFGQAVKEIEARSAERQALADAIENHRAAVRDVEQLASAIEATEAKIKTARRVAEEEREAASSATAAMGQFALATAIGSAGPPPATVAEARAAAEQANDDFASLAQTLAWLEEQIVQRQSSVRLRAATVYERAADVVRSDPGVRAMIARFPALHVEFVEARNALQYLRARHLLPDGSAFTANEPNVPDEAWRAALLALERNADFALPT